LSEIRTDTISAANGTDPVTLTTQSAAKAWVNFNGTGTIAARDSYNLSSLSDNGTGNYTINISNSFSSANYASLASGNRSLSLQYPFQAQNNSASACQIGAYDASTFADIANIHVTAHGDLA